MSREPEAPEGMGQDFYEPGWWIEDEPAVEINNRLFK
jgi:hypothetical protein